MVRILSLLFLSIICNQIYALPSMPGADFKDGCIYECFKKVNCILDDNAYNEIDKCYKRLPPKDWEIFLGWMADLGHTFITKVYKEVIRSFCPREDSKNEDEFTILAKKYINHTSYVCRGECGEQDFLKCKEECEHLNFVIDCIRGRFQQHQCKRECCEAEFGKGFVPEKDCDKITSIDESPEMLKSEKDSYLKKIGK